MNLFLQYEMARHATAERVRSATNARDARRLRRARRRSRAPDNVTELPRRLPAWEAERAAS
jgi:hypothetical protein